MSLRAFKKKKTAFDIFDAREFDLDEEDLRW